MEIDLRLLRHARALAEHGRFGRAARALRLTQPALSRSIAQLERQVGARLFERNSAGVEPTDVGRLLLERAADLLTQAADLGREIDSLKGLDAGELHLGAGTYPAETLVGSTLARLLQQRPDVRVRVVVDNILNLIPLLRRRELDVVIGDATHIARDADFHITELAPRQGYFVGRTGHPLLNSNPPGLADVLKFPLVSTSRLTPRLLAPFIAAAPQLGAGGQGDNRSVPSIACESLSMMKAIVADSNAIAILPLGSVASEISDGTLAVLPLVEPWLQGNFAMIRLARRTPPPSGEEFARLLLAADAELTRVTQELEQRLFGDRGRKLGSGLAAFS